VKEYYCSSGHCHREWINCGEGACCKNGKCTTIGCESTEVCDNGADDDGDGDTDCDDYDCCGSIGPNTKTCCAHATNPDSCCPDNLGCNLATNECRLSCTSNGECASEACCKYVITRSSSDRVCKGAGYIFAHDAKSYLCDPPGWGVSIISEKQSEETSPIFNLVLKFFQTFLI